MKDLQEIENAIGKLRDSLEEISSGRRDLDRALKARGLRVHTKDPHAELLLPPDAPQKDWDTLYEHLKRYSFRLFLRDAIAKRHGFALEDLLKYCSREAAQRYLETLLELKAIVKEGGTYTLRNPLLHSFGPTLEWFIAELFRRELDSPAYYGVRLYGTPHGGDFDVIALWQGYLVYTEVKSSPPRGVEREEIRAFLLRLAGLIPDCAILFNDTHLRMADKIVPFLEEELSLLSSPSPLERLTGELFHTGHRLFVINSKKSVLENFLYCLRDFLSHTVPRPWPSPTDEERD